MYFHADSRLMFLAAPRTASRAIAAALKRIGFEDTRSLGLVASSPAVHHLSVAEAEEFLGSWGRRIPLEYETFTVVRNHWDAIVSWLCYTIETDGQYGVDDVEALCDMHSRWIGKDRLWGRHRDDALYTLRYEDLESDLGTLLADKGLSFAGLPVRGRSRGREGKHYSDLLTVDAAIYIRERFAHEIELLGYHYEEESA